MVSGQLSIFQKQFWPDGSNLLKVVKEVEKELPFVLFLVKLPSWLEKSQETCIFLEVLRIALKLLD